MRIVIEGPDGTGKSTLIENARQHVKRYFAIVRHSRRPLTPGHVIRIVNWLYDLDRVDLVIDRHPLISEPIYGPLLREEDLTEQYYDTPARDRILGESIHRIVYCRPPVEEIRKNVANTPQLAGVASKIDFLIAAYDEVMASIHARGMIEVVVYDYTVDPSPDYELLLFGNRE